ncbi:hypothetical protein IAT40_007797 [Kwoniella sp. CBS 6097]
MAERFTHSEPGSQVHTSQGASGTTRATATDQTRTSEADGITSPAAVHHPPGASTASTGGTTAYTTDGATVTKYFAQHSRQAESAPRSAGYRLGPALESGRGNVMEMNTMTPCSHAQNGHSHTNGAGPGLGDEHSEDCGCSEIGEGCLSAGNRCVCGKPGDEISRTCRRKTWGVAGALGLAGMAAGLAISYGGNDGSTSSQ